MYHIFFFYHLHELVHVHIPFGHHPMFYRTTITATVSHSLRQVWPPWPWLWPPSAPPSIFFSKWSFSHLKAPAAATTLLLHPTRLRACSRAGHAVVFHMRLHMWFGKDIPICSYSAWTAYINMQISAYWKLYAHMQINATTYAHILMKPHNPQPHVQLYFVPFRWNAMHWL